jgi:hypothetical protein
VESKHEFLFAVHFANPCNRNYREKIQTRQSRYRINDRFLTILFDLLCPLRLCIIWFMLGEETANTMPDPDEVLSVESLENLKHRLQMLHPSLVEKQYREAYERCDPVSGRVPKASSVQALVTCWRVWRSMMDKR